MDVVNFVVVESDVSAFDAATKVRGGVSEGSL